MNALPRTEIQRRLDADFDQMFQAALPPIAPPLSPAAIEEGNQAAERG